MTISIRELPFIGGPYDGDTFCTSDGVCGPLEVRDGEIFALSTPPWKRLVSRPGRDVYRPVWAQDGRLEYVWCDVERKG